jgi:hypothetical protein
VLCKTTYRRMTNLRITGAVTRESCRAAQGTGQLDLFTKKIITSFWDWRITCVNHNNQWTNVITFINTTASHTLQMKSVFVLHSHWNTTLDHSQRTSSVVQCCNRNLFQDRYFLYTNCIITNALHLTLQHSIMLHKTNGIVQSLTAC